MTFDTLRFQRKSVFRYPMDPAPRTAVLAACFRQARFPARSPIRLFPEGWSQEVADFAPAAVAATREHLLEMAGLDPLPEFTHAVIVLACPGDPLLPDSDRALLWRAFRVPVFEQIVGPRGALLAAECEAHNGLHVEAPGMSWDGYRLELAPCGCGRKSPRLAPAEPAEPARSAMAYAR